MFSPREINWPVLCSELVSGKKDVYLMIHVMGYEHNCFKGEDSRIVNLYCQYLQSCIERVYLIYKSNSNIKRSLQITHGMKDVLAECNHALLLNKINTTIAKLFGFEKAAVLFKQSNGPNLYDIIADDLEDLAETLNYSDENIITYPMNMGVTGKACSTMKITYTNKGEMDQSFAPELDNFSGVGGIKNMMAGPLIDKDGTIRGVVQLFNKYECDFGHSITRDDVSELNCITTSLGELIKAADMQYLFMRVWANMSGSLNNIEERFGSEV